MGRDKALLPYRGGTLGAYVARAVRESAGSVVVVGRAELLDYPAIPDIYPGEGPLGGILTALAHSSAEWNLIVACDMPGITAAFLSRLLQAARESGRDAFVPTGPSGRPEPLCAVYHARSRSRLEAEFARGVRKVGAALAALDAGAWQISEVAHFQNVNTPEDWAGHVAE